MKLQWSQRSLRVRIDEHELAQLQADAAVRADCRLAPTLAWSAQLQRGDQFALAATAGHLQLTVAAPALADYAARLPCREGLDWPPGAVPSALTVTLEVDVRDSVRQRGVGPRRPRG